MKQSRAQGVRPAYVPELDGLRGIAILMVMVFHAEIGILNGGFIGVDTFFVLSGYLITSLMLKELDENQRVDFKQFFLRRILRLYPAYGLLLICFVIACFVLLADAERRSNLIDVAISVSWISNWARALGFHPPQYLGHTWSLSIEAQFYLIWPFLLTLCYRLTQCRWRLAAITAGLFLVAWLVRVGFVLSGASIDRMYNGLDTRADALLAGCVLAMFIGAGFIECYRIRIAVVLKYLAPVCMVALLWAGMFADWKALAHYYWGMLIVELVVVIIILDVQVGEGGFVRNFLSLKPLVWIGSISYGLYLWHYPIYAFMRTSGFDTMTVFGVGSTIIFLVSYLSFRFLERPILQRAKQLGRREKPAVNGASRVEP